MLCDCAALYIAWAFARFAVSPENMACLQLSLQEELLWGSGRLEQIHVQESVLFFSQSFALWNCILITEGCKEVSFFF